jgi:hypothetical protein
VDPASHDIRTNGTIYNEEIFQDQIKALRQRLERCENLVYAQNTKFVMGVGKSALIAREWRRLQQELPETTIYVRCGPKTLASTVDAACNEIVSALYRQGALWRAFCQILLNYVRSSERPALERGVVDSLIAQHPKQPRTVPSRALMIWDLRRVVEAVSEYVEGLAPRIPPDIVALFVGGMLSEPNKLMDAYLKKSKRKEVTSFIGVIELLRVGGAGYLYAFLDQFEELFHGRGKKDVLSLAAGMRQILEASSGLATFVVTLHPSAAMSIQSPEGQSLTTVAPVDDRHVVDLPNIGPREAILLARTYLDRFRCDGEGASAAGALDPFSDDCIQAICLRSDGNIRKILQTLHAAVDAAAEEGCSRITADFFEKQYRRITGRVPDHELELP